MVARVASLVLGTMDSLRWLLPSLLVLVMVALVWLDGPAFLQGVRLRERSSLGGWIVGNFWILLGLLLAIYVSRHYPRDPW